MRKRIRWSSSIPLIRGRSYGLCWNVSGAKRRGTENPALGARQWTPLMLRMLDLSAFYNHSDDQIVYQFHDWLSFSRFLGPGLEDRVPDVRVIWRLICTQR